MNNKIKADDILKSILSEPAESRTMEFKRLGKDLKVSKIIETAIAMANTDGGVIVLGVENPQKSTMKNYNRISGIEENLIKFDEIGRELIRISPPIGINWPPYTIESIQVHKTVGILLIPKVTDHIRSIDNHVYVRLEQEIKLLTPHEIIKYSYAKGFQKADNELVSVDFDLLKTEFYEKWRKSRKIDYGDIKEIFFHTGLARKNEDKVLLPTRAAVLLFACYPHLVMETKCAVRIFQYEGTIERIDETMNLIGTPKTIEGPIIKQIEDAHDYVLTLLRSGMRIPSSSFVTFHRIPERAIKEAITNAVIHRDYFIKRDIEVKIFEDRVEIDSPGLFPYNITAFNVGFVRADGYRNDLLVKHLREFPEPPNLDRNEGVRAMRSEMDRNNLYPPVFLSYPHLADAVRVILFNSIKANEWDKVSSYLSTKEKYVTNEKVREIINNPDTSKVSRVLKKWVDRGLLIKIETGAKKTVKYRLPIYKDDDLFAKE